MRAVIVGEGHEDHEHDRQHGKDHDARERKSEKSLVELLVDQAAQVVGAGFQAPAGALILLGDLVLLDVEAPGIEKGDNKEDRQHAVEQDLEGVVAVSRGIGVEHGVVLLMGADPAQRGQQAQPVAAGCDHVKEEDGFKEQEHQPPQHLAAGHGPETHHQEGGAGLPVALLEGREDVGKFPADAERGIFEEAADRQEEARDRPGDRGKEACQPVDEFLTL